MGQNCWRPFSRGIVEALGPEFDEANDHVGNVFPKGRVGRIELRQNTNRSSSLSDCHDANADPSEGVTKAWRGVPVDGARRSRAVGLVQTMIDCSAFGALGGVRSLG